MAILFFFPLIPIRIIGITANKTFARTLYDFLDFEAETCWCLLPYIPQPATVDCSYQTFDEGSVTNENFQRWCLFCYIKSWAVSQWYLKNDGNDLCKGQCQSILFCSFALPWPENQYSIAKNGPTVQSVKFCTRFGCVLGISHGPDIMWSCPGRRRRPENLFQLC